MRNKAIALNPVGRYLQKTPFGDQYLTFPAIVGQTLQSGRGTAWLQTDTGPLSALPTNVSFGEAASIPLAMITAAAGLYQKGGAGLRALWRTGAGITRAHRPTYNHTLTSESPAIQLTKLSASRSSKPPPPPNTPHTSARSAPCKSSTATSRSTLPLLRSPEPNNIDVLPGGSAGIEGLAEAGGADGGRAESSLRGQADSWIGDVV
ncbi:hypothetical protein FIBSPDRAFT_887699 [Athelia psychrophila]|uniref:Uncharacterized protein n=1 Tax=Athelia psychrophila TaxID=1759441 RepID=A0A166PFM6_9AGAM|nr:hypothetical protein FIBSPDRAFT_887699 [Fibularhizoctonia sp. CBS 109695]